MMTTDSALPYHPTDSLILPTKRRFFPFRIPNFHLQLHHYISTADPDRIYAVVDRVVYAIHISARKRETIAVIPFEPRCLAAGYGWIGVGGSDNGECAFIEIADRGVRVQEETPAPQGSDVDSTLPIDLESPLRASSGPADPGMASAREAGRRPLPDVQLHKFGGSIVNSVTVHRIPGDDKALADEDFMVLSNNDKTVTVYSLTRSKVLKVLHHPYYMNYAIMSPDSNMLVAVGDEPRAYFYDVTRDFGTTVRTDNGQKLTGWKFDLLRSVEMDTGGTRFDDGCCFTIAFSQFSRHCAIGSQSGVITVFDVKTLRDVVGEPEGRNSVICNFNSSRLYCNGGAVRCMAFAPEPWDLLVWLEDKGRAGIADVRQSFTRRQVLQLDLNDPEIEEVRTEPLSDDAIGLGLDLDGRPLLEPRTDIDAAERAILDTLENSPNEQGDGTPNHPLLRDPLVQDLTERERLIVEFLNTARWSSRLEEGLTERRLARSNVHPPPAPRPRFQPSTDNPGRPSRPTSPPRSGDTSRDPSGAGPSSARPGGGDRRPGGRNPHAGAPPRSDVESDSQTPETTGSQTDPQPSITLSWTASPSELQGSTLEIPPRAADPSSRDTSSSSNESSNGSRPSVNFDYSNPDPYTRTSALYELYRQDATPEPRYDSPRMSSSELRTNVAAERIRRQRQIINEAQNRHLQREQRYRQQLMGIDQSRSPRWTRSAVNEVSGRGLGALHRDQDSGSTAGLGWGADGRTLYVATVDGVFEFQVNIRDRKTFPTITYR
ncbi:WD40-repeat-containing domain protein [Aspergillus taichungensis]|uniref:WD40-repeat-containing domain protein n=1 Tax=Aspergillus taichungensis TaxID=482145 RepID=A0A2J5HVH5_9EURO|nr:WD40-repeat-containing domain protein [Aspergillus taichungensis]